MLPGMELMGCRIEVPASVMHHVVKVESSYNPYAIGVVGGRLARQPRNLPEAVATAEMLEARGLNFSLGLAQVNRYNLPKFGLADYGTAFKPCANLLAGSRILSECRERARGHWGKAFSCYYSGNFTTGFRHGYVQKIQRSMQARGPQVTPATAIPVVVDRVRMPGRAGEGEPGSADATKPASLVLRRAQQQAPGKRPSPELAPTHARATEPVTAMTEPLVVPVSRRATSEMPASRPSIPEEAADAAFVF